MTSMLNEVDFVDAVSFPADASGTVKLFDLPPMPFFLSRKCSKDNEELRSYGYTTNLQRVNFSSVVYATSSWSLVVYGL